MILVPEEVNNYYYNWNITIFLKILLQYYPEKCMEYHTWQCLCLILMIKTGLYNTSIYLCTVLAVIWREWRSCLVKGRICLMTFTLWSSEQWVNNPNVCFDRLVQILRKQEVYAKDNSHLGKGIFSRIITERECIEWWWFYSLILYNKSLLNQQNAPL